MGAISDLLGDTWTLRERLIFIGRTMVKMHHISSADHAIFIGHDHDCHRTVATNHDAAIKGGHADASPLTLMRRSSLDGGHSMRAKSWLSIAIRSWPDRCAIVARSPRDRG